MTKVTLQSNLVWDNFTSSRLNMKFTLFFRFFSSLLNHWLLSAQITVEAMVESYFLTKLDVIKTHCSYNFLASLVSLLRSHPAALPRTQCCEVAQDSLLKSCFSELLKRVSVVRLNRATSLASLVGKSVSGTANWDILKCLKTSWAAELPDNTPVYPDFLTNPRLININMLSMSFLLKMTAISPMFSLGWTSLQVRDHSCPVSN